MSQEFIAAVDECVSHPTPGEFSNALLNGQFMSVLVLVIQKSNSFLSLHATVYCYLLGFY